MVQLSQDYLKTRPILAVGSHLVFTIQKLDRFDHVKSAGPFYQKIIYAIFYIKQFRLVREFQPFKNRTIYVRFSDAQVYLKITIKKRSYPVIGSPLQ
jgi:hypothetical protein